jgi:hypothetical protein
LHQTANALAGEIISIRDLAPCIKRKEEEQNGRIKRYSSTRVRTPLGLYSAFTKDLVEKSILLSL